MTTEAPESATVSVPEAARLLGISRAGAYRAAAAGQLPAIRIGARVVISRARLMEMIEGKRDAGHN